MILHWEKSGRESLESSLMSLCLVFPHVHSLRYHRQNCETSIGTWLLTKPWTFFLVFTIFLAMSFYWSWIPGPRIALSCSVPLGSSGLWQFLSLKSFMTLTIMKTTSQVVCRMFPNLCWSGIFVTIRTESWVARVGGCLGRLSKRWSFPL